MQNLKKSIKGHVDNQLEKKSRRDHDAGDEHEGKYASELRESTERARWYAR